MPEFNQLPVLLRASRKKHLLFLLVSIAFVAIGVMMVRDGEPMGYFCSGFFALGAVVFVINMLPNASYLRLDETSFTFCSLFRAHTVPWAAIQEFGVFTIRLKRMVAWNFVPGYTGSARLQDLSRAVSGFDAALPDTYGLSANDLVEKMAALHDRYTAAAAAGKRSIS